jgi:hypothetical protein
MILKMAALEYKKIYGPWTVTLLLDGKVIERQSFLIINPIKGYTSNNSIINVKFYHDEEDDDINVTSRLYICWLYRFTSLLFL